MTAINDQLGVSYSLKEHIQDKTDINTVLHYSGMKLPDELPFIIVRSVLSPFSYLSKGKETVKMDFNFEISLYERSLYDLTASQDELRRLLLFGTFPYYTRDGKRVEDGYFESILNNENTVTAEDITDKKRRHKVFFEISVEGTFHKY